ncbi:MAG: hypothetical protein AAB770_02020, partial [Patescibacteria group bacterium]
MSKPTQKLRTLVTSAFFVVLFFASVPLIASAAAGDKVDYPVGIGPVAIAFDNATNSVWVVNVSSNTVSKVN